MATSIELLNDLIAISLTSDDAVDRKRAAKLVPVVRQDLSAEDRALCAIWLTFPSVTPDVIEMRVRELIADSVKRSSLDIFI